MLPYRHLLFIQRSHPHADRGLRWARDVANRLGATLSVRADTDERPWDSRSALEGPWDLVLKVAEPRRGFPPWRMHPTDRATLAEAPLPVWLLHPAQGGEISSVLAAVGLSRADDMSEGDRRVIRSAALLARRLRASLTVVRPWTLLGESILASPTRGVSPHRYRQILEELQTEHERHLELTLAAEIPDTPVVTAVRKGPAETVIRRAGWRVDAEVLVMEGHDGPGLASRLLGPLPERLFRGIPCSLLLANAPREDPVQRGFPVSPFASLPHPGAM